MLPRHASQPHGAQGAWCSIIEISWELHGNGMKWPPERATQGIFAQVSVLAGPLSTGVQVLRLQRITREGLGHGWHRHVDLGARHVALRQVNTMLRGAPVPRARRRSNLKAWESGT